jgi:signal recognition particle subunit SRP54
LKIIYEELVALMGPVDHHFRFAKDRPSVIMLCGLQGSGKTTTCAKLAVTLKQLDRKPLLVAADLQRPAAVEQLKTLGTQIDVPVHAEVGKTPLAVCRTALEFARSKSYDTVILDTAGRLHIDQMPMDELKEIDRVCKPDMVYLVCDAMTGQDAVNSSKAFNDALELDGVILTKLDGDTRGGAALSIKEVTKVPIKWIGVGEKVDRLEKFHPERMASRILGEGDLMSLVEVAMEAQSKISEDERKRQQEKLEKGQFTLEDFRKQFAQVKSMGLKNVMGMLPGMEAMLADSQEDPDTGLRRIQGMIDAMTKAERKNPDIIDLARRRRIAAGSGTQHHEIKKLLDQFSQVQTLMKQLANMSLFDRMKMMMGMSQMGALMPGGELPKQKQGTGHRKTAKERAEERKKSKKKKR